MRFPQCIFITFLAFVSFRTSFGQDSIRTDVFSLSTCFPTSFSLIKVLDGGRAKREFLSKLEVKSNRLSVLQISGINPLRYKYYLNNEAVTQFMETSPLTLSINNFVNGDYVSGAPEITIPEIFKTDSISTKVKQKINDFHKTNSKIDDSISLLNAQLDDLWLKTQQEDKDTLHWEEHYAKKPEYKSLYTHINNLRRLHDLNLAEYQMFTSGLPLNNPRFGILDQYRSADTSEKSEKEIDSIRSLQRKFANQYYEHHSRFKRIDSLMDLINQTNSNSRQPDINVKKLIDEIRYYNFSWIFGGNSGLLRDRNLLADNLNNVTEQVLNKRFQLYEEFVLLVVTRLGVLVQNQFREYSSFNNTLEALPCIDEKMLDSVKRKRDRLIKTFYFIQQTNAELQIMVSYLDINTDLYQSVAKRINSNYLFLLSYLKNLDYIISENTRLFTLPTHTNLKNIDLLRYTVKREDKLTKSTQTYNYDFWIKGGLKIDFSFGFFGTRLTDNVYNKVLLDTAGGIDKIRITRQDDGRASFAFGGMVNIAPRNGASWVNVGGSVGLAYSNNQKLQVLTGLALHFGKTERLIVHAGAAFGTIKYLDISANEFKFYNKDLVKVDRDNLGDVKENERVYMLQSPDIKFSSYTIPTVEKFVVRPFIGISYNLSKKSALQAVSGNGVSTFSDNYKNGLSY